MTRKRKAILRISILVLIIIVSFFLPSIKSLFNQTMNKGFIEKVESEALTANIQILLIKENSNGANSTSISYIPSASGVIIAKEGNKYYALTAYHGISESDNVTSTNITVLGYDDLDFKDYLNNGGKYRGLEEYYNQFPKAVVEYSNEKYDLALISFITDKAYAALSVSDDIPKRGDIIAAISNPSDERNVISVGRIKSRKEVTFGDEIGDTQYPVIKHSAGISEGSSGSALLNEDLEIVGINLGGNENIFRQYISGMAMPSNRILEFLGEWEVAY